MTPRERTTSLRPDIVSGQTRRSRPMNHMNGETMPRATSARGGRKPTTTAIASISVVSCSGASFARRTSEASRRMRLACLTVQITIPMDHAPLKSKSAATLEDLAIGERTGLAGPPRREPEAKPDEDRRLLPVSPLRLEDH